MSASGNQVREQMLGLALQTVDMQEREISALQTQVAELQKQLASAKQQDDNGV